MKKYVRKREKGEVNKLGAILSILEFSFGLLFVVGSFLAVHESLIVAVALAMIATLLFLGGGLEFVYSVFYKEEYKEELN